MDGAPALTPVDGRACLRWTLSRGMESTQHAFWCKRSGTEPQVEDRAPCWGYGWARVRVRSVAARPTVSTIDGAVAARSASQHQTSE